MKAGAVSVLFIALFGQFSTGYSFPSVDDKSKDGEFFFFLNLILGG